MLSSIRKSTQTLHELTFCSQELFDLYFIKFDEYSLSLKTQNRQVLVYHQWLNVNSKLFEKRRFRSVFQIIFKIETTQSALLSDIRLSIIFCLPLWLIPQHLSCMFHIPVAPFIIRHNIKNIEFDAFWSFNRRFNHANYVFLATID